MAEIDIKDRKIGEVPHLDKLTGEELLPVSADGKPANVRISQIREGLLTEEEAKKAEEKIKEEIDEISKIASKPCLVWRNLKIEGKENSIAGDVLMWDGSKKYIMNNPTQESLQAAKDKGHTPIGIVVIPASHDVYGTGECGVISLVGMSYNTPDEGGNDTIYFGQRKVDLKFPYRTKVPSIGYSDDQKDFIVEMSTSGASPSDDFTGTSSLCDKESKYNLRTFTRVLALPSPFSTDESSNPIYRQTTPPSSEQNAFSDFDGLDNSKRLWELATAQSDWRTNTETKTVNATDGLKIEKESDTVFNVYGKKGDTAIFKCTCADCKAENCQCGCECDGCKTYVITLENTGENRIEFEIENTQEDGIEGRNVSEPLLIEPIATATLPPIENNGNAGYSPAACCCWRYHTEGTNQGDWYLPAEGELGYVLARVKKIDKMLNMIGKLGQDTYVLKPSSSYLYMLMSSSVGSDEVALFTDLEFGLFTYIVRDQARAVRAFTRV